MSYRDPYSEHYASTQTQRQFEQRQEYDEEFYNPYTTNAQPLSNAPQPYFVQPGAGLDNNDEMSHSYPPIQRTTTLSKKPQASLSITRKEASGFELGELTQANTRVARNRTPKSLRDYRYDHQGNLWTKGGRGRCAARVCCCSLMTTVFLVVSIALSLALWVRPPSIYIGNVQTIAANGATIQQVTNGIQINLGVNISVNNPNYFSVDFKKIEADIFYPINDTPVGGGSATNLNFNTNSQTNFTFPFSLIYNSTADPQSAVILDLAKKCGVLGEGKSNVIVNYKISLAIHIALITISPSINNQFSFPCPLQASDISKFLGGAVGGGS